MSRVATEARAAVEQKAFVGRGSIVELRAILERHRPRHIFLVTGRESYAASGAEALLEPLLRRFAVTRHSDFAVNPRLSDIVDAARRFRQLESDFVIAVGGGSALDVGKAVRFLAPQAGPEEDYVKGRAPDTLDLAPMVAVPTTAGSGSEATHFAVVYIDRIKHSLAHAAARPDYAIVDPTFTDRLPSRIRAASGLDALAHGVESYWSIHSTTESKRLAREAIERVWDNLEESVLRDSERARDEMAHAAHLAGCAIDITKTTAAHAISYPLTVHFGVAHGHAVCLTLPHLLVHNAAAGPEDVADPRGVEYVRRTTAELAQLLGARDEAEAAGNILKTMERAGLAPGLRTLGIDDVEVVVRDAFAPDRMRNNPRLLSEEALREILATALQL